MLLQRVTSCARRATTRATRSSRLQSAAPFARGFASDSSSSSSPPPPRVTVLRHEHKPPSSYVQAEQDIAALQRAIRDAYNVNDFETALELGTQCRDAVQGHFGESHPVYASTITNMALMYKSMGQFELAIESYEHALRVYKASVGEQHASFATTLHNLGAVYQALAHAVKGMERVSALHRAEECFTESLRLRRLLLEPGHPDIALSLCNLGSIHRHNKQLVKADKVLREALGMLEARVGRTSTLTALAMNNLALVHKDARRYDEATALLVEVVGVRQDKWGPEHNETIMAKHNLAEVYRASGNEDKAVEIQKEILELFEVVEEEDGDGAPESR